MSECDRTIETERTIRWIIEKQERLRATNIQRASGVAVVAAIILAAYSFLAQRAEFAITRLSGASNWPELYFVLFEAPGVVGLLLCVVAIYLSLDATLHLSGRTWTMANISTRSRIPFHGGDTVDRYNDDFEAFHSDLINMSTGDIHPGLTAELWSIHKAHDYCHGRLRKAGWLVCSAGALLCWQFVAFVITRRI